uniref:Epoxide hydrolase 2 n=1 Tax=Sphenodon punctatus TaxID=8508 RepID=A0A8D0GXG5_SPHPU
MKFKIIFLISRNFLLKVFEGGEDGPFARAMRGQIVLSQLVDELEENCKAVAASSGVSLPENFSVAQVFEDIMLKGKLNLAMLQAVMKLRGNGFKAYVLTNNWIDDGPQKHITALALTTLRRHFDQVIESCRVGIQKPNPQIFEHTLDVMKAKPQEVIFLDDTGANLIPARDMGMATIRVRDTEAALKELQELSGVQLLSQEEVMPTACVPENVAHGYVSIKPGVQLHYVEMGSGPVVCLCHGFPDCWLSWRHQIPALADAGFRVIALEMKGYGDSTSQPDIEEYSQEAICKVKQCGIPQAVFIGHDWGGAVVWNMALFYPERVKAVAGLNTPYKPANPSVDVMEKISSIPVFDYQLYFQEPGVAEAHLEENLSRTFKIMIRSTRKEVGWVARVVVYPGWSIGTIQSSALSLSVSRGPLNWYRNMPANWRWIGSVRERKITVPALMVTAGQDRILSPSMSKGMENWVSQQCLSGRRDGLSCSMLVKPRLLLRIVTSWQSERGEGKLPLCLPQPKSIYQRLRLSGRLPLGDS